MQTVLSTAWLVSLITILPAPPTGRNYTLISSSHLRQKKGIPASQSSPRIRHPEPLPYPSGRFHQQRGLRRRENPAAAGENHARGFLHAAARVHAHITRQVESLQLPAWTVQRAMERMSAFFHLGPVLLTKDVPANYDATDPLDAETWLLRQRQRATDPVTAKIRLPVGGGKKGM